MPAPNNSWRLIDSPDALLFEGILKSSQAGIAWDDIAGAQKLVSVYRLCDAD